MTDYVLIYKGKREISATRSIHNITGYGLIMSTELTEHPQGFIVNDKMANGILKDYLVSQPDHTLASVTDWSVKVYDEALPVDLRIYSPVTSL